MRKVFLWWLIAGSKGSENRARIIKELKNRPYNINQLADKLSLNYRTVRYHIDVLEENGLVRSAGKKYGALYFLTEKMENEYDVFLEICKSFKQD